MPIRKYVANTSFDPETIKTIVTAFEDACTVLNLHNPDDPLVEIVAKKTIAIASQGVIDPTEISRRVVADTDRA